MAKQLDVSLLPHQAAFLEDQTRYCALVGGYAAGKTRALAYKVIQLAAQNRGYEGILLSPTFPMLWQVAVKTLIEVLEDYGLKFEMKKSEDKMLLYFGNKSKPSTIHFRSAENYARLAGLNLAWAAVDEIDTMKPTIAREAWSQINSRIRVGNFNQTVCVSTPEGFGFMWSFFENEPMLEPKLAPTRSIIRGSTLDNPFIPDEYIHNLKANYPPHQLDAYLMGQFVNLTSSPVYYAFDKKKNHTDLTIDMVPMDTPIHCGIDFNLNSMSCTVGFINNEYDYVVDEIMGSKNTSSLIDAINQRYQGRQIYVYPDASGAAGKTSASASDIAQLFSAGFQVFANKANPRVKDRVSSVNARFLNGNGERRLLVNTNKCKTLTKSLQTQVYNPDGTPVKDGIIDGPNDAIGYWIHKVHPVANRGTFTQASMSN
jgi:phage terminase large subunit